MKQKRKGSAILMVLMVSTILIILSAVVSSSLVSTTRGNSIQKRKSDYVYAAEGGIEQGVEKYNRSGSFTTFTVPFLSTIADDPVNGIKDVTVEFLSDARGNFILSTVKGNTDQVLARIKAPVGGNRTISNVLENTIYSSSGVEITPNGPLMMGGSNVTYDNSDSIIIRPNGDLNPPTENGISNPTRPEFNSSTVITSTTEVKAKSLEDLWNSTDAKTIDVSSMTAPTILLDKGIGKFEIDRFILPIPDPPDLYHGIHLGQGYKVILVDAPKLLIDLEADAVNHQYIVICSGSIEFTSTASAINPIVRPQFFMNAGTLYGNGVYFRNTVNMTITGSPMNTLVTGCNPLRADQMYYLDTILSKYMTNWGSASAPGAGAASGGGVIYEDIEYMQ